MDRQLKHKVSYIAYGKGYTARTDYNESEFKALCNIRGWEFVDWEE